MRAVCTSTSTILPTSEPGIDALGHGGVNRLVLGALALQAMGVLLGYALDQDRNDLSQVLLVEGMGRILDNVHQAVKAILDALAGRIVGHLRGGASPRAASR